MNPLLNGDDRVSKDWLERMDRHSPGNGPARTPDGGRDAQGRFAKGNPGGPGNPFARRAAALRKAAAEALDEGDIAALLHALYRRALAGDIPAAKLVLDYSIGKPGQAPDPDRLDADEMDVVREAGLTNGEVSDAMLRIPASAALPLVNAMQVGRESILKKQVEEVVARGSAAGAERPGTEVVTRGDEAGAELEGQPIGNGGNGDGVGEPGKRKAGAGPIENGSNGEPGDGEKRGQAAGGVADGLG